MKKMMAIWLVNTQRCKYILTFAEKIYKKIKEIIQKKWVKFCVEEKEINIIQTSDPKMKFKTK